MHRGLRYAHSFMHLPERFPSPSTEPFNRKGTRSDLPTLSLPGNVPDAFSSTDLPMH